MSSSLATLVTGEEASIIAIQADEVLRNRLVSLGFRVGQRVRLIRRGAFSGPLQVRIGGTDIIIRRRDAARIEISRS
ncbi:MAG: ferrous iron transport protein A [Methylococcaceae bacterium]|nr:ferrous iron transport protein A [Methylococcaceae bacterium]